MSTVLGYSLSVQLPLNLRTNRRLSIPYLVAYRKYRSHTASIAKTVRVNERAKLSKDEGSTEDCMTPGVGSIMYTSIPFQLALSFHYSLLANRTQRDLTPSG